MNFVDPVFRGLGISIDKDAVDAFKDRSKNVFAALPLRESTGSGQMASTGRELAKLCSQSASGIAAGGKRSGTAGNNTRVKAQCQKDIPLQVRQQRSGRRPQRSRWTNHQQVSSAPPKERPGYTCYIMGDVDVSDAAIAAAASDFLRELVTCKKKKLSADEPESEKPTAKFGSRRKKKKPNTNLLGLQEQASGHRCNVGTSSVKLNLGWQSQDLEDSQQPSGESLDSRSQQTSDIKSGTLQPTKHDAVLSQPSSRTRFRSRRRVKKSLRKGSSEVLKRPDSA